MEHRTEGNPIATTNRAYSVEIKKVLMVDVRCSCGHLLYRAVPGAVVEAKCNKCKEVNYKEVA